MPLRTFTAIALALGLLSAACSSDGSVAATPEQGATTATEGSEPAVITQSDDDSANGDSTLGADDSGATAIEQAPLGEQMAAVTVTGEPLPPMPPQIPVTEPDNDPAIGVTAPELSGTDFSGHPVDVVADGTPRVVMFVAHWCPHCQREVPAVIELIDSGEVPDGLELVVVSTAVRDGDENFPPQRWLEAEAWPGPIMRDSEAFDALLAFGAGGFPFSVYLNGDHEVVTRSAGEIPSDILTQLWLATAND